MTVEESRDKVGDDVVSLVWQEPMWWHLTIGLYLKDFVRTGDFTSWMRVVWARRAAARTGRWP